MAATTIKTPPRMSSLYRRLEEARFPRKYVREVALPSWWDDSLAVTNTGYADISFCISRRLGIDLATLLDDDAKITLDLCQEVRFKSSAVPEDMLPATSIALRAARLVMRAMTKDLRSDLPTNPADLRQEILRKSKNAVVNLEGLLHWCWEAGIPVVYLKRLPSKKPQALCLRTKGRPVIFLCDGHQYPAWQAFHLAHEIGHICSGHLPDEDSFCVDDSIERDDTEVEEKEANAFAVTLLLGKPMIAFEAPSFWNAEALATSARIYAKTNGLDPASIVLNALYYDTDKKRHARNIASVKLLEENILAETVIYQKAITHLDFDSISLEDAEYLKQLMGVL
jgi:Zn-dependent peptidase ImmA (M78 family)